MNGGVIRTTRRKTTKMASKVKSETLEFLVAIVSLAVIVFGVAEMGFISIKDAWVHAFASFVIAGIIFGENLLSVMRRGKLKITAPYAALFGLSFFMAYKGVMALMSGYVATTETDMYGMLYLISGVVAIVSLYTE